METKVKEVPTFLKFWRVIIHSSASWLHSTRIFCKLDTFAKVCLSKTCYLWKDIQRFVLEFYLLLQISSDVSPKKLYKKRKSSWIYQIFKNFETLFSLSNVFVKDRSLQILMSLYSAQFLSTETWIVISVKFSIAKTSTAKLSVEFVLCVQMWHMRLFFAVCYYINYLL